MMRIFYDLSEIQGQIEMPAVTVGSFDGVHAGHRAILDRLKETAAKSGGRSVVVTFDPHPRQVLQPAGGSPRLLNSLEEKIHLLEQAGIDHLFVIRFTPEFSRLTSETFARRYLLEGIGAKTIVMGYNHLFGHARSGNRDYLETLRNHFDFEVCQLPRLNVEERKVSSTVLRALIATGEMQAAAELLGKPYFFIAREAVGGRLTYGEPQKLFPPAGVYPATVNAGEAVFDTDLIISPDPESGFGLSLGSPCLPGQKLIVRFRAE